MPATDCPERTPPKPKSGLDRLQKPRKGLSGFRRLTDKHTKKETQQHRCRVKYKINVLYSLHFQLHTDERQNHHHHHNDVNKQQF